MFHVKHTKIKRLLKEKILAISRLGRTIFLWLWYNVMCILLL